MPDPEDNETDTEEVTPEEAEGAEVVAHSADEDEELPACIIYITD